MVNKAAPYPMTSAEKPTPRPYWTSQMELAITFMERMRRYPVQECGEPMVPIREATAGLRVEFSDRPFNEQFSRIYSIRSGLGESLRRVAKEMNERGWILKIEDGYRSPAMQRSLTHSHKIFDSILRIVMWELEGKAPSPDFMLRRTSAIVATRPKVGTHISGSAIDISVLDGKTRAEIGRGGPYIEVSEKTPMDSPFVTAEEQRNRKEITAIFARHGWAAYPFEFWHYSGGDCYAEDLFGTGKPARYGPMVWEGGAIRPLGAEESDALLEPVEFYRGQIAAALGRLGR
jgi:zinc D-Ala-D-Ala dipeptidase